IFAAEQSAGERRPCYQAEIEGLRHRDQLALDCALYQRILNLQADELRQAAEIGESVGLRDPSGERVGDAEVENLALTDQVVERAHEYFDWSHLIPDVKPVEIDV